MDLGVYGFRHDPMLWALSANTLDGAWVRTRVLEQPRPEDAGAIDAEVDRIYRGLTPKGDFGEMTHGRLVRLLDLGCAIDDPRFHRALTAMCAACVAEHGQLWDYALTVACRAEWADRGALADALSAYEAHVKGLNFWHACPWTGEVQLQVLWAGREIHDSSATIEQGLATLRGNLRDGRHWPVYLDPWGWLECMGVIDHPIAREIVVEMIPMILRAQVQDGSWGSEGHMGYGPGSHSLAVFRALHRWGLLAPLCEKPPLPAEWAITRTIPTPEGVLRTMTWDGEQFWVYDAISGEAIAVSAVDGAPVHTVQLPANSGGIAWRDGSLLATQIAPEVVRTINPTSGDVIGEVKADVWGEFRAIATLGERTFIGNGYCGGVHTMTGNEIAKWPQWLAGGFAVDLACADGAVWHIDAHNRLLIASDPEEVERLLDWAGVPFGEDAVGLAWDGAHLWALDGKAHRICQIERVAEGQKVS